MITEQHLLNIFDILDSKYMDIMFKSKSTNDFFQ